MRRASTTTGTVKAARAELVKRGKALAAERDALRDLRSDIDDLISSSDDAIEGIDAAIDALSRYV